MEMGFIYEYGKLKSWENHNYVYDGNKSQIIDYDVPKPFFRK